MPSLDGRPELIRSFDIGSHSDAGNRYAGLNQDVIVVQEMYTSGEIPRDGEQTYVLAVCDGHGILGDKSASYAGKAIARHLFTSSLRNKHIGRMPEAAIQAELEAAFKKGHAAANSVYAMPPRTVEYPCQPGSKRLARYSLEVVGGTKVYHSDKGSDKLLECGTTATVVVLQGCLLCLADVGDSLAVLGHEGASGTYSGEFITCRHYGLNQEEAARISSQHSATTKLMEDGYVHITEGVYAGFELAVTRALGHQGLEKFGIIDHPYVNIKRLTGKNPCLILGSDGLWDEMGPNEAVSLVMASLQQGLGAAGAARALVEQAVRRGLGSEHGQQDNTSAVVVSFVDRLEDAEGAPAAVAAHTSGSHCAPLSSSP